MECQIPDGVSACRIMSMSFLICRIITTTASKQIYKFIAEFKNHLSPPIQRHNPRNTSHFTPNEILKKKV
jgi:hypothetical protein